MNNFDKLKRQVQSYIFLLGGLTVILMVGGSWVARQLYPNHDTLISVALLVSGIAAVWAVSLILTDYSLKPLDIVWRAILHVTPGHTGTAPPNLEKNKIGQELVTTLALQIYQLASLSETATGKEQAHQEVKSVAGDVTRDFPMPIMAIKKDQTVSLVNDAALKYLGLTEADVLHKNLYSIFDLSFTDEHTLDNWLQDCRANKATDQHSWQRVRLKLPGQDIVKQFDLAAAYSKENPNGIELILTAFDQTSRYQSDDQSLDFIALAVHELRTPLTALRGYIEVFEDELAPQLNPEMLDFMHKMQASAQQLTAFVSNILNVARIQEGQLSLQLNEENWASILKGSADNLSLPAQLKGLKIQYSIDPKIPTVAVDKISITEVLNNLLDNAIKYSGTSKTITITARLTTDGLVETVITDDGVGIPASVMPTLFEKFHRNHRNQAKIGGTGLGLYLSSSIVKAHNGNIWLKSKEGQGTSVGFTLVPYSQLAGKLKDSNNNGITRNAHGWIKNHSLYRR
ncbi:MAG: ATP-binding protein [Candidatus Saccharimonadales bacterium]